jgi:hypothetical protein
MSWPQHLSPGALRVSHSSVHYDHTVAFYRDLVGLPLIGQFTASFGEDGTIFGLPGLRTHLEIVRARTSSVQIDPLDQLVFYLAGEEAVAAATAPLRAAGVPPDPSPHPYWVANHAAVHLDPDGRRIVFAPWIFGDEPEPATRATVVRP